MGTPASDVRVVLFAGFLGSGKTTLISALVRRASELGLRLCLVVNEVGEVGIDGAVLRVGELEVRELTSGCICCQTGVDLVKTLWELNDHFSPDLVIVEASGIATPAGVLGALRQYAPELAPFVGAVTLVDPTRLAALYEVATPLIEAQIGDADLLVVTKADEASPEEIREACKVVQSMAPTSPVYIVDALREETLGSLIEELLVFRPSGSDQRGERAHEGGLVVDTGPVYGAQAHGPDLFEPYGAHVRLSAQTHDLDLAQISESLLVTIAATCGETGAGLIGHLKCFARTEQGSLRCNLTSVESGARCIQEGARSVPVGAKAALDLAVLVYGLSAHTIDGIVETTLQRLLDHGGGTWTKDARFAESPHRCAE